ncbi:MAG TPA: aspartyl/asparaginyl beta-hydroxylase domain-containing protein [Allosphingosinicella sp.]|nr:aspartyl/asparaginyl beta-hydroxylase domain-containing protein [Allosphingosinicella sp.]
MDAEPSRAEADADAAAQAGRLGDARQLLEAAVRETPTRFHAWLKLAAMCRGTNDFAAAMDAVSRALALDPLDLSALLMRAMLLERMGRAAEAGEAYGHALAQRPPGEAPPGLAPMIAHAEQSYRRFQEAMLKRLRDGLPDDPVSVEERGRIDRFLTNVARLTRPFAQEPSHFHFPGLPPVEFHDRGRFPWLGELERATAEIRREFETLIASEAAELVPYIQYPDDVPLRQWETLNRSRDWTAVHLLQNGRRVETNARHCPRTMALLERLPQPDVPGASPNAMFSLLAPRTRIPPHTGVANTRLVCHLPLIVPAGCGFRVGAETRSWQPGSAFVFDDTIEHEAWNDSAELRVVFIFDIWAWALSEAERRAVAAILPRSDAAGAEGL